MNNIIGWTWNYQFGLYAHTDDGDGLIIFPTREEALLDFEQKWGQGVEVNLLRVVWSETSEADRSDVPVRSMNELTDKFPLQIIPVQGNRRCNSCSDTKDTKELVYQHKDGVWGWSFPLCPPCRLNETHRLSLNGFTHIHTLDDGWAVDGLRDANMNG